MAKSATRSAQAKVRELAEQNDACDQENRRLRAALSELEVRARTLSDEVVAKHQAFLAEQARIPYLCAEIDRYRAERNLADQAHAVIKHVLTQKEAEIATLRAQIEQLRVSDRQQVSVIQAKADENQRLIAQLTDCVQKAKTRARRSR